MLPKLTKQAGFITQSQFTEGEKKNLDQAWVKHSFAFASYTERALEAPIPNTQT